MGARRWARRTAPGRPDGLLAAWASRLDVKEAENFTRLTDQSEELTNSQSLKGTSGPLGHGLAGQAKRSSELLRSEWRGLEGLGVGRGAWGGASSEMGIDPTAGC